tara:strand:- start:5799 stop:8009 length:2211 start_codon:yes stop_codon:yes gene_type:complete
MMEKLDIKLLFVEDDTIIRNVYKQILKQFVKTLYVASDGKEGYDSYLINKPDLIVTDIKMPIMNGLDMINKIREQDKEMRIIIMSAYSESRFFINAIESGVKGFLIKPVETHHLKDVIREQANDILLEKRLDEEAHKRQQAEGERNKGEDILRALLMTLTSFFHDGINDEVLNTVLALIGDKTNVSRSYIFKVHYDGDKQLISQNNEWVAEGITAEIKNPILQNMDMNSDALLILKERLSQKQSLLGKPEDFIEPFRSQLIKHNIKSLIVIPIFVKETWWGFVGFDDCDVERYWTDSEIYSLEMLAVMLGGALYRKEVEDEMTHLNLRLEERVFERTKELELEIAERTNAQMRLKESEEKYRLIYDNANDGIFLLINNVIILINPKVSEILNVLPKNIIGSELGEFVKDEYKKVIKESFSENTDSKDEVETQVQLKNKVWLEMKATSIYWGDDPAYLVFVSNITMRKKAEYDLNSLNKNLEIRIKDEIKRVNEQQQLLVQKSKLESIGELSAGLAHEINQPLGGISMGLENIMFNLNSGNIDNNYLRTKIDILFSDIERIKMIIEHVRLFSRDQDKDKADKIIIIDVINNALGLISKQMQEKNIELIRPSNGDDIAIMGNQYRLEQVFLNILSNARHAVEEMEKKVYPKKFIKKININIHKDKEFAKIIITDNGIGINKSIISKVFDPFFTTKSEEKGTGLGLSISYGIISEMDGKIDIESKPEELTKITIQLPIV